MHKVTYKLHPKYIYIKEKLVHRLFSRICYYLVGFLVSTGWHWNISDSFKKRPNEDAY